MKGAVGGVGLGSYTISKTSYGYDVTPFGGVPGTAYRRGETYTVGPSFETIEAEFERREKVRACSEVALAWSVDELPEGFGSQSAGREANLASWYEDLERRSRAAKGAEQAKEDRLVARIADAVVAKLKILVAAPVLNTQPPSPIPGHIVYLGDLSDAAWLYRPDGRPTQVPKREGQKS